MLKIVIDTNVLIDASEDYYRYANRILDLVLAGQINAFANKATIRENRFLASQKITDEGYLKKLEYFLDSIHTVDSGERLHIVEDDPQDNKILESAISSKADYLITSDRHLLKLEEYEGVKIVRPEVFWQIWEEEGEGWTKWITNFIR